MKNTSENAVEKKETPRTETGVDAGAKAGAASANLAAESKWVSVVEEKVRNLRFGIIQITIHNGKVVQIDSTEKTRVEI